MARTAIITGITGQDGSYLAELLLEKGYDVIGMVRRLSLENYGRIEHILDDIRLVEGDLLDSYSLMDAVEQCAPDEVYNLAAQSFVPTSFTQPMLTADFDGLGVLRWLEAIRRLKPDVRFYQASTSEMFGKVRETPQNELTAFHPRSPYGTAKVFAYHTVVNYRESYGLFACNGILFNHESPRRGMKFVTRKVTDGVARIKHGLARELRMGNLDAKRDWGYAGDYVRAMWLMLQQPEPRDYVVATGETKTVRELCRVAFARAGLDYTDYVVEAPEYHRPAEVDLLLGDASKARAELGWQPEVTFEQMIAMMVDEDVERLSREA